MSNTLIKFLLDRVERKYFGGTAALTAIEEVRETIGGKQCLKTDQ